MRRLALYGVETYILITLVFLKRIIRLDLVCRAEKKSCLTPEVWKDLAPGDRVKLFFDDKGRVQMAALDQ